MSGQVIRDGDKECVSTILASLTRTLFFYYPFNETTVRERLSIAFQWILGWCRPRTDVATVTIPRNDCPLTDQEAKMLEHGSRSRGGASRRGLFTEFTSRPGLASMTLFAISNRGRGRSTRKGKRRKLADLCGTTIQRQRHHPPPVPDLEW